MKYQIDPAFLWVPWVVIACFLVGFALAGWGLLRFQGMLPPDQGAWTIERRKEAAWALLGRVLGGDAALRTERTLLYWGFGLMFGSVVIGMMVLFLVSSPIG